MALLFLGALLKKQYVFPPEFDFFKTLQQLLHFFFLISILDGFSLASNAGSSFHYPIFWRISLCSSHLKNNTNVIFFLSEIHIKINIFK